MKTHHAGLNLALLVADDHHAAAADDHVDLLASGVGVDRLLAAGQRFDPGHRQP
jgi:hypothetical protein